MTAQTRYTKIKEVWVRMADELGEEQLQEALDFALFLHSRQTVEDETVCEQNQPYPLRGTVLEYNAPFEPVAEF